MFRVAYWSVLFKLRYLEIPDIGKCFNRVHSGKKQKTGPLLESSSPVQLCKNISNY